MKPISRITFGGLKAKHRALGFQEDPETQGMEPADGEPAGGDTEEPRP